MRFYYEAKTAGGQTRSGEVEAISRDSALTLLRSHGLFVSSIEEIKPSFYQRKIYIFRQVSSKEIVIFFRQMAVMFKSEMPILEILGTTLKQIRNQNFREKIMEIMEKVESGMSLSKAFSEYPEIFTPFHVNMVRSGEASGKLSEVFVYLADYLERDYDFNRKVKGVMIYPIFISVIFLIVISIMIFFVVPKMAEFVKSTNTEVPFFTKFLFSSSEFLKKWWIILLLIPFGLATLVYFYARTKEGKVFFDEQILKIPFLRTFFKSIYLARFSLNLSTLVSGGLSVVQALDISGSVVGNEVYKNIISEASDRVKKGDKISSVLLKYPEVFPPLFVQMVVVGEKTGRLDSVLNHISDFYRKETESQLEAFMRILEPVLIVFFGILVGGLVASIIIPIYQTLTSYSF